MVRLSSCQLLFLLIKLLYWFFYLILPWCWFFLFLALPHYFVNESLFICWFASWNFMLLRPKIFCIFVYSRAWHWTMNFLIILKITPSFKFLFLYFRHFIIIFVIHILFLNVITLNSIRYHSRSLNKHVANW